MYQEGAVTGLVDLLVQHKSSDVDVAVLKALTNLAIGGMIFQTNMLKLSLNHISDLPKLRFFRSVRLLMKLISL